MRLLLVLVAVVAAVPVSAQSPFAWPAEGRPTPTTTSAPVAYAASFGATAGLIGGGMLLMRAEGFRWTSDDDPGVAASIGMGLVGLGVMVGPTVGNALLLGTDPTASRGAYIRWGGTLAGVTLFGGGGILLLMGSAGGSGGEDAFTSLAVLSGLLIAGGIVSGTVYDLAVIPENAERARAAVLEREARRAVQVGLAPVGGRPGVFAVVPL